MFLGNFNDMQIWTPQKAAPQFPKLWCLILWGHWGQHCAFEWFPCNPNPIFALLTAPWASFGRCGASTYHAEVNQVFPMAASSPRHGEQARLWVWILGSLYPSLFMVSSVITCSRYAKRDWTVRRWSWVVGEKREIGLLGRFPTCRICGVYWGAFSRCCCCCLN